MPVTERYSIGIDFGTESGRVLLLNLDTGEQSEPFVVPYRSAVIDRALPGTSEPLPADWALQDPDDWMQVVLTGVPAAVSRTGVDPASVLGIGVDFTSCTVLPVAADATPLCSHETWRGHRHAWPKLWKHHAAQPIADRLSAIASERGEDFLQRYGGRISSEWYFPKLIEIWLEDRDVYEATDGFFEATDWIVSWCTGVQLRQACTAGYKALWSADEGFPSNDYFEAAFPGFSNPIEKLGTDFVPLGSPAGHIRAELATHLGLPASIVLAVGNVDSFVSVPGAGVSEAGTFVMVIGTSICDMVVHRNEVRLPGITGVLRDGILPGLYGYEAGQAAVGDMLAWFVSNFGGGRSYEELENVAAEIEPGQTGLLALDWWNGNRTILADADLSGVLLGLTIQSSPAEIYRALLESIAFGNRRIMDNFEEHGMPLNRIVACGGIAEKSPLMMQLLADTSGRVVSVPAVAEIPARGAALYGAVAAGAFRDIRAAVESTRQPTSHTYEPNPQAVQTYDRVYGVYRELYETLGRSHSEWLHALKRIRADGRDR